MGMYTELIFGAALKKETPREVIDSLKYIIGDSEDKPNDFPLPDGRCESLFRRSSYYFGVSDPVYKMWFDEITETWRISTRSNIKDYENEIETFLQWIKQYIEQGSGVNDMYAVVTYEEAVPKIYSLRDR